MNKQLLVVLCSVTSLSYASEQCRYLDMTRIKNQRPYQEDEGIYAPKFHGNGFLCAVFDGHGDAKVASYLANNFPQKFESYLKNSLSEEQAFKQAFFDCEESVIDQFEESGSTALVVYINNNIAHIANVGDSRAVFGNKNGVVFTTHDQTLAREDERNRIIQAGGAIYRYRDRYRDNQRGLAEPWRINGLAMSRAIGDKWAKGKDIGGDVLECEPYKERRRLMPLFLEQWPDVYLPKGLICTPKVGQLIAEPEYTQLLLTDVHRWLIIATDGLWDEVRNEEALTMAQCHYDKIGVLAGIARVLAERAIYKFSQDNITVFVIDLLNLCNEKRNETGITDK